MLNPVSHLPNLALLLIRAAPTSLQHIRNTHKKFRNAFKPFSVLVASKLKLPSVWLHVSQALGAVKGGTSGVL